MVNLYRMRMLMSRKTVNLLWRIEQEQARATKITTVLTGMPRGGKGSDQVADGAVRITELKEAYSESIAELEMMRQELLPLINTLDNVDLRAATQQFGEQQTVFSAAQTNQYMVAVGDETVVRAGLVKTLREPFPLLI